MSDFKLPNRKVLVKPIIREGKWLGKGHSGNFMYDNTKLYITVPISRQTGGLIDPLTMEERDFLENRKLSGLDFVEGDLNINKKPNPKTDEIPFWYDYQYTIIKNESIINEDTVLAVLDLSNPNDYIAYKVLMANTASGGMVAPSWEDRFNQGSYKIALVDSEYAVEEKSSRAMRLGKAYTFFNKIMKSDLKMYELLSVYWLENRRATKPSKDASTKWLISEIESVIDKDLDSFLRLIETDYEEKLMIHQAMVAGALTREGATFINMDGNPVGNSVQEVILYFKDERHQEDKLKLLALIDKG